MPKDQQQTRIGKFNLIGRDLEVRDEVTEEKDWYVLLNVLVICVVVAVSTLAFIFNLNIKAQDQNKADRLAKRINEELNVPQKGKIRSRINTLEEKVNIYDQFLAQNFDVNKFYNEVKQVYVNSTVNIEQFSVLPDSERINMSISIEKNGYIDLPQFITIVKSNARFSDAVIKNVSFELPASADTNSSAIDSKLVYKLDKADTFITRIDVEVSKSGTLPVATPVDSVIK
jgi:Tfp pilus assembly protein PilO